MKGLCKIPDEKKITQAYRKLKYKSEEVLLKDLALYSQWARLDPRLGEMVIEHLAFCWEDINPIQFNYNIKKQVWPSALGALLAQIPFYYLQKDISWNKELFLNWKKCVMTNIPPATDEQFFIGIYKVGGKLMKEECFHAIKPYRQWGYFAKDLLINKAEPPTRTLLSSAQRQVIINSLIKKKKKLTVQDYLEEINFQIHPRQAQRDLKNHPQLKPYGYTKGRYYMPVNKA